MRIYKQTQNQEHDDLEEPCETIEECVGLKFLDQRVVPHYHTCYIDCEISISIEEIGGGVGDEYQTQYQDGVE